MYVIGENFMNWIRDKKSIKDLFGMYQKGALQLQPFFQRNLVWTDKAKSQFIESILLNLPISEVYLYENEQGLLSVIDGQQRLSTIFHFLEKKFTLKGLEKLEGYNGKDADFDQVNQFENFEIYFVKIDKDVSRGEIIDTYSRINRYTVNLNAQELRRATYSDSDFLKLSEELSELEFFEYGRFFTTRKRERMNDIEFISELLACMIDGIQDKRNKLDEFYINYTNIEDYEIYKNNFNEVISEIESIFNFPTYFQDEKIHYNGAIPSKNLGSTRYKQQADFYSLFFLFRQLKNEHILLNNEKKEKFLKMLLLYDRLIAPEAYIDILSTYAVKCVSQGNTKSSREFRYKFLRQTINYILTNHENELIQELISDLHEVYDYTFDLNVLDLDDLFSIIESFEQAIKEND